MKVKDLIKHLKKMPQTKQVLFFNHDTETLLNLDDGAWNVPNTKWVEGGKKGTYINHVEIAGRYTGEGHNVWVENKQQASRKDSKKLTIEQIDKKINSIEEYYNNFNMMSYEYDLKDKMYLGRLYKLKLKLLNQQASKKKG